MLKGLMTLGPSALPAVSCAPAIAQEVPDAAVPVAALPSGTASEYSVNNGRASDKSDQTWIVLMNTGKSAVAQSRSLAADYGADVRFVDWHTINDFASRGSDKAAEARQNDPNVLSVEHGCGFNAVGEMGSNRLLRIDADATYGAGDRGTAADAANARTAILDTGSTASGSGQQTRTRTMTSTSDTP